jgi:hypothetical protein
MFTIQKYHEAVFPIIEKKNTRNEDKKIPPKYVFIMFKENVNVIKINFFIISI